MRFKAALCQIEPSFDTDRSMDHAEEMIATALVSGAKLICFPEMFYHPYSLDKVKNIHGKEHLYLERFARIARQNEICISTGSMVVERDGMLYNMSHLITPDGCIAGEYSKCHLYDARLATLQVSESSVFTKGHGITVVTTPLGKIGIMICYDIRFPEFSRLYALEGVDILLIPSVFNVVTGSAHWSTMVRSRAIENQFFVLATSQGRIPSAPYAAYGHSMACDPWGEILCEALEREQIVYADIDLSCSEKTKNKLPLLSHRRTDLYNLERII
jgi:predicted amidohydrolase